MGDRDAVALAKAMLALGVRRFVSEGLEVEFHDAAIGRALTTEQETFAEVDPEEAYRVARRDEDVAARDAGGDLDLLFRSAG